LEFLLQEGREVLHLGGAGRRRGSRRDTAGDGAGVEIIAQGALASGNWFGQPDVLRKSGEAGQMGSWSYEAYDCKLARETKATTILQLSFYSELLREIQGADPESMWVVAPGHGFAPERYRVAEYAAYYRYAKVSIGEKHVRMDK